MAVKSHPVQLLGWKSREKRFLDFRKCPGCGKLRESLFGGGGGDGKAECYRCGGKFPFKEWGKGKALRYVATCGACGNDLPLTSDNISIVGGPFYICNECSNFVAVYFAGRILSPLDILSFKWAPEIQKRAERLGATSYRVAEVRTKAEHLVMNMLLPKAKEEEPSFIYGVYGEGRTLICMDDKQYIGYLRWSVGKERNFPVLRQWYIAEEYQRKGIGLMLLKHWAEKYAFRLTLTFGVEAANKKTLGALVKAGYAKNKGKEVVGIRCRFVPGM